MDIDAGSLVYSIAGRDKNNLFVVLKKENDFCYVANGRLRKVSSPKKKKLKHVKAAGAEYSELRDRIIEGCKVTDAEIRRSIAKICDKNE